MTQTQATTTETEGNFVPGVGKVRNLSPIRPDLDLDLDYDEGDGGGHHEDDGRHRPREAASPAPARETAATETEPTHEATKRALLLNPKTGNSDYIRFQARCVRVFDPVVGIFARQAVYWHGRSSILGNGWIFKKREEWCEETGLTHRQLERARLVLREKGILEEGRPSRRAAMHFRVDLEALKDALEAAE